MGEALKLGSEPDAHLRDPERVRLRALAAVEHWIALANKHGVANGRASIGVPPVTFNVRGRAAGKAVFNRRTGAAEIRLNAELLRRYPVEMIQQTVPHEVAHVVTRAWWGGAAQSHGREWQSVMTLFGKSASRCHSMDVVPTRVGKVFAISCMCDKVFRIGERRYKRFTELARLGRPARCRRCKSAVVLGGESQV